MKLPSKMRHGLLLAAVFLASASVAAVALGPSGLDLDCPTDFTEISNSILVVGEGAGQPTPEEAARSFVADTRLGAIDGADRKIEGRRDVAGGVQVGLTDRGNTVASFFVEQTPDGRYLVTSTTVCLDIAGLPLVDLSPQNYDGADDPPPGEQESP